APRCDSLQAVRTQSRSQPNASLPSLSRQKCKMPSASLQPDTAASSEAWSPGYDSHVFINTDIVWGSHGDRGRSPPRIPSAIDTGDQFIDAVSQSWARRQSSLKCDICPDSRKPCRCLFCGGGHRLLDYTVSLTIVSG